MTFSLFSLARRSTTDIARHEFQAPRESGEFVDGPVELTLGELRLVGGGDTPKGGWGNVTTTTTTTTSSTGT